MQKQNILWIDFMWIFLFSFTLRVLIILKNPSVYAYDAYIYLLGISSQYPLFTGFIKILIACNFSVFMIRIVTAIAASCSCLSMYLFTNALFGSKTISRTAAFLMSIYPPFLIFSVVPYTEPFFFLMFFAGLWCFENKKNEDSYILTGIFIGLASLIRYEACLIIPIMFAKIVWIKFKTDKHKFVLLKDSISLLWGPVFLFLYNRLFAPELSAAQCGETEQILREIGPLTVNLFKSAVNQFVPELISCGLIFPVSTFIAGIAFAIMGWAHAFNRDRKNHLIYIGFILMATLIQFLPMASMFRDYSKILGLRRNGMVPAVFLLCYFSYIFDVIIQLLGKRKIYRIISLICLLFIPVWMSYKANSFIISDYQKLYRSSSIQPYWIGQYGHNDTGMIVSVKDRVLIFHLSGKQLKQYPAQQFSSMKPEEIEVFINEKQIMYVLTQRDFLPSFKAFLNKSKQIKFRNVAIVGGWLFVYVRE